MSLSDTSSEYSNDSDHELSSDDESTDSGDGIHTLGINGSDVYTKAGVGDYRIVLDTILIRGKESSDITNTMDLVYKQEQNLLDLFLFMFYTRDIEEGKGERKLSYTMFNHLLSINKSLALQMLHLFPIYGYWKDLVALYSSDTKDTILKIFSNQILKDEKDMIDGNSKISLLAKWLPRENKKGKQVYIDLVSVLYPGNNTLSKYRAQLRKRIVSLNKHIKTVEIKMCANQWSDIVPKQVPGRALKLYSKAFAKHPETKDRFVEFYNTAIEKKQIIAGSKTVMPHELINELLALIHKSNQSSITWKSLIKKSLQNETPVDTLPPSDEELRITAQWNSIVERVRKAGGLGRSIAMCDFSGSMISGEGNVRPIDVCRALGLLISEVTTEEFKDTVLTFATNPVLHKLPNASIKNRLLSLQNGPDHGMSTDFQKALNLVLTRLIDTLCKPGSEPEYLIVLTDMGWNEVSRGSQIGGPPTERQFHIDTIKEKFKMAGELVWGVGNGWKMPTLVIWNLSTLCTDFHVKAETEGVLVLSGWSQGLFGAIQKMDIKDITPLIALRAKLDSERYNVVRDVYSTNSIGSSN